MKPYGLLSDSHFHNWNAFSHVNEQGVNNRLVHILDTFEDCAKVVHHEGGDTIYHGGDLFHVRGSIPPSVINYVDYRLSGICNEYGVKFVFIPGNHDMEFNDSKSVGYATSALEAGRVDICYGGIHTDANVMLIPWKDKLDDLRKIVSEVEDKSFYDLVIHAPMNGVIMGIPDHGLDAAEVAAWGFNRVFVGHYHSHKAFAGGVYSIGATTHQTFSDVGTKAGFCLVTKDDVVFYESRAPKFVAYNLDWDEEELVKNCKDNYVRLRLGECTEEEIRFIRDEIIKVGAHSVLIEATPTRRIVEREGTQVTSGQSLLQSVTSFVEQDDTIDDKEAVLKEVVEILTEIQEVA